MIVAGDIGGTHTRVGAFSGGPASPRLDRWVEYKSRDYGSMEEIVKKFLDGAVPPERFCFGVSGPVVDGKARPTNLTWEMDGVRMTESLGAPVSLINDLEANAYGVATLGPEDLAPLQEGRRQAGNKAVISAGTGLGEAGLYWDGSDQRPFASEGGHSSFSAETDEQVELWQYLHAKFPDHVSWERVLSGPGLLHIYQFFRDTGGAQEEKWLRDQMDAKDAAAVIAENGMAEKSVLCAKALDLFVELYGSEAGNLALKVWAVGGVYVGGGIAPRILEKLKEGRFQKAFVNKGRMRAELERIPVHVILNEKTALQGAARRGMLAALKTDNAG